MNNSNKTPAVSPAATPGGWDPFGNNASSNAQGTIFSFSFPLDLRLLKC